ncbi:ABC transporter substrate-binding protein, partial [Streptomyces sp. NPDC051976]
MRTRTTLIATATAAALALTGCAAGSSSHKSTDNGGKAGDVTLTFLTFETPNLTAKYWDDAIARA